MEGNGAERNSLDKDVSVSGEYIRKNEAQKAAQEVKKEAQNKVENKVQKKVQNGIDAFEIFEELFEKEEQPVSPRQERTAVLPPPVGEDSFYEIEYDSGPFPGVGKYVLKSSKIEAPYREQKDEIRERFDRMRDIAREARTLYFNSSKFYDRRVQEENSRIFYKQGIFMEDFEDEFEKSVPYSAYYPGYQNMGYEQLRTYFTWRTKIRQGNLEGAPLSYAFLYIYELLNNIGVKEPEEGLDSLMVFWDAFRVYDATIDKYLPGWLKDYHIYYGLEQSFGEFIKKNKMAAYYPELEDSQDQFELFCYLSKYDIRKSVFYADGNEELLRNGFSYVMEKLERAFEDSHIRLEEFIFQPTKNMTQWTPFKGALFYSHIIQSDRRVVLSKNEVYVCSQNRWTFHTALTTESGKKLISYVMKQTEAVLRKAVKYRHKLSAGSNMLSPAMAEELEHAGICLERLVTEAAMEYYREINKTVVKINSQVLERIRREALVTQEKLIVPEQEGMGPVAVRAGVREPGEYLFPADTGSGSVESGMGSGMGESGDGERIAEREETAYEEPLWEEPQKAEHKDDLQEKVERTVDYRSGEAGGSLTPWENFGNQLDDTEFQAVAFLLYKQTGDVLPFESGEKDSGKRSILDGGGLMKEDSGQRRTQRLWDRLGDWENIRQFAAGHGIMPEVLADGINEKAMDHMGDSLLDDEFMIYEDYLEQAKEMVEEIWQRRYLQG